MNLEAIRNTCRVRLQDMVQPHMFSDEWLDQCINEAENEAAERSRLIEDDESDAASIDVSVGDRRFDLHDSVIDIISAKWESTNDAVTGWTLTEKQIVFDAPMVMNDRIMATVIRLPRRPMTSDKDVPEIAARHHLGLVDWVLHKCYLAPDADLFNAAAGERHLMLFEANFGQKHTANARRQHRQKGGRMTRMNRF